MTVTFSYSDAYVKRRVITTKLRDDLVDMLHAEAPRQAKPMRQIIEEALDEWFQRYGSVEAGRGQNQK